MGYRYGYSCGYRGWGPWCRRLPGARNAPPGGTDPIGPVDIGWGWVGVALWIVLLIAIVRAIGARGWGSW